MTFSFKENNATWSNTEVSGNTKELENNPHQLPNNDMGFLKHPESNWKASSGVLKKRCLQLCVAEFNVLKETSERARRHSHGRARAKYEWGEDIARLYSGKKDTECEIHVCGWIGGMSYVRRCMPCLFWIYTHTSIHFHGSVLQGEQRENDLVCLMIIIQHKTWPNIPWSISKLFSTISVQTLKKP